MPQHDLAYASPEILPVCPRLRAVRIAFISLMILNTIGALLALPMARMRGITDTGPTINIYLLCFGMVVLADSLAASIAGLCGIVFFCMWVHRACFAARAIAPGQVRHSPAWAVGSYFVPFINLVLPFLIMKQIWKAAHAPEEKPATPVSIWWTTYLATKLISNVGYVADRYIGTFTLAALLSCLSVVVLIVCTIVCLRMITEVSEKLDAKISQRIDSLRNPIGRPGSVPDTIPE